MGWPGSRAKFAFNSWDGDTVQESTVKKTTIKISLKGVILPRFDFAFGVQVSHKTAFRGKKESCLIQETGSGAAEIKTETSTNLRLIQHAFPEPILRCEPEKTPIVALDWSLNYEST
jgi:hypothetical protein